MPETALNERSLILQPQAEGQIHLPGFEVPVVSGRPVCSVSFDIERAARRHLLVHIHGEAIGNDRRVGINAHLLEREFIDRGASGSLLELAGSAKITADGQKAIDLARPGVRARIQMLGRQDSLREHIPEGRAQAATGRIDVALAALEAHPHGKIRLGVRLQGNNANCEEHSEPIATRAPGGHGGASAAVNTTDQAKPKAGTFMSEAPARLPAQRAAAMRSSTASPGVRPTQCIAVTRAMRILTSKYPPQPRRFPRGNHKCSSAAARGAPEKILVAVEPNVQNRELTSRPIHRTAPIAACRVGRIRD